MMNQHLMRAMCIVLLSAGLASADLDGYLSSLRVSAEADLGGFRAALGMHFGASGPELDQVFLAVGHPGEAALCLWLARNSGQPLPVVLERYRQHQHQGWGALAQSLGIKPGSAQFKALKAGEIGWRPPGKPAQPQHGAAQHQGGGGPEKGEKGHKGKKH